MVEVVVLWGSGGRANNANNATSKLVVDIKVCVLWVRVRNEERGNISRSGSSSSSSSDGGGGSGGGGGRKKGGFKHDEQRRRGIVERKRENGRVCTVHH